MREQIQKDPSRDQAEEARTQESIDLAATVVTRGFSYWKLALGILLVGILVSFAIQNANAISVKFLMLEIETSQALVIFLTLLSGLLIGVTLSKWQRWRLSQSTKDTDSK